jgi:hypothetical protein
MKKTYILSVTVVLALMGMAFLAAPGTYLGTLGVQVSDPSVMNMIRSFGGFYLGFAAFIFLISRREGGDDFAVLAAVLAMAGFLVGRALGLASDGVPARSLFASAFAEIVFGIWGVVILSRSRKTKK